MHYHTLILELLEQQPSLHAQLKQSRMVMRAMAALAQDLKTRHESWHRVLRVDPKVDPAHATSMAMEYALQETESLLSNACPERTHLAPVEPLVEYVRQLTLSD